MSVFLNVYDLTRKKTAVLQNAFGITETQELNKIYTLDFSIPSYDEKIKHIQPFHYIRYGNNGELYRVIKSELQDDNIGTLKVSCEHVITTLCDNVMFGSQQYGGGTIKTSQVITWLLNKQSTKNWVFGSCDFDRKFEYLWEQENILNALYSIPKEFSKAYIWTFDTVHYPWKISLKLIDESIHPEFYIRAKKNLLSSGSTQDFTDICTRIYPLGYGEGVNQLTIKDATVTNIQRDSDNKPINADVSDASNVKYGNTYIQSPASITNTYGIKEKVLVDRRYENANSLFSYAKTMLESLQVPQMSRSFDVVDLYPITSEKIDDAEVGKICKMTGDGSVAYITKTTRVLDDPGNLSIEISTKATDVASSIADLADRVRIESVYAQGATQLYQHSKDANATSEKGSVLNLYFPGEMKQINKVLLKVQLERFRSYSKATEDGGKQSVTSEDGGKQVITSEDGGKQVITSEDGGATISTGVASGGGGISLGNVSVDVSVDVDVDVTIDETSQANWTYDPSNLGVKTTLIKINNDDYETSLGLSDLSHTHNASAWGSLTGYTSTVTPLENYNYRHSHSLHDGDGGVNVGVEVGGPSGFYPNITDYTGHAHTIDKRHLQHTHSASGTGSGSGSGTGSVPVNNSESGQSGFSHSHTVDLPNHSHNIDLPDHSHNVVLPDHSHVVNLPEHKHDILPGIFEASNYPKSFSIYVNGVNKTTITQTSWEGDITNWLLNSEKRVPRDSWIKIEIRPDDLAYIVSSVFVQGFVQSRGGGNY